MHLYSTIGLMFLVLALPPCHGQKNREIIRDFEVTDSIRIEAGNDPAPASPSRLVIHGNWSISPENRCLHKTIVSSAWSPDRPEQEPDARIRDIQYEFPCWSQPDSSLGSCLDSLVSALEKRAGIPAQNGFLGSVIFHEDWKTDSLGQVIQRQVKGLRPVYWQTRQTVDGTPVPEAGTGLPVYFKQPGSYLPLKACRD